MFYQKKVLLTFLILLLVIPFGVYLVSKSLPKKKTQNPVPVGAGQAPVVKQDNLDNQIQNCSITKEGNPLIDDVQILDTSKVKVLVGTFRANINKITPDATGLSPLIELASPRADQTHSFRVTEEKGLVYDSVNLKDLTLKDLKPGKTVSVSFNCFPSRGNLFKLTRFSVLSKE